MDTKNLVGALQCLTPIWQNVFSALTPLGQKSLSRLVKSGLAEVRMDVIVSRRQQGALVQIYRTVYVVSGDRWEHNLRVTAGNDAKMKTDDERIFGTGIFQHRLTAHGQNTFADAEAHQDGFLTGSLSQAATPFKVERYLWEHIQSTIESPERKHTPWIDAAQLIEVMKHNGSRSTTDKQIQRKNRAWGAEEQTASNGRVFRFKFATLRNLGINHPPDWTDWSE